MGPNTHYNFEGNAKAVPFGTTIPAPAPAAAAAGAPAAAPALSQINSDFDAYDASHLDTYAQMIADNSEEQEQAADVEYTTYN